MINIIKTMADEIIELEIRLLLRDIGSNCPFAMYPLLTEGVKIDCNKISCCDCEDIWREYKVKEITKNVYERYGLIKGEDENDVGIL